MRKKYEDSILYKLRERIDLLKVDALLRSDFSDLGSYRQISRALSTLVKNKELIKIGFGIYARAEASEYSGRAIIKGNVDAILRQALNRLEVEWEPGSAETAYNSGKSTQIPLFNIVKLKDRLRRKIGFNNYSIVFEGGINAR